MAWRLLLAGLAAVAFVGSAAAQTAVKRPRDLEQPPVWRSLERFSSDAELMRYIRDVQRLTGVARRRAETQESAPMAVPAPPPPPSAAPADGAVSNLSAAQAGSGEQTSITNVQTQGVDEGGIVKMVGRFLVVLQDGRLFVVDTRPGGAPGLALAGRTNVYRSPNQDTWYDELLISGNRVLVTGYSYREAASEVTVFTIDDNGQLAREATYYISSNDYYDTENYSTRLVNGNLVIYTPLDLTYVDTNARMRWPLVRRWLRDDDRRAVTTIGQRLFDARDIYKPIQTTRAPMVHSVSVCPLGGERRGDELDCRTTAFVGPGQREFFVSTSDIYLWVTPNRWRDADPSQPCPGENAGAGAFAVPATLYQVPLSGASPRALHTRGQPTNQLAMDASATEFRALLGWNTSRCNRTQSAAIRYFRAPLNTLATTPQTAPARSYTETPSVPTSNYEVRFTGTHVVYGGRGRHGSYPPAENAAPQTAQVIAVPVAQPRAYVPIEAPHDVLRIERTGANIVLTGYRDDSGLSLSNLDLRARPHLTDTRVLNGRFESENRSHAFNSMVGADGAGLMGLPTVTRIKQSGRWVWRSDSSDVSYLSVDATGRLSAIGELSARRGAVDPSYRCEVSCVDWYGNTRALYIGARVFALSGTELIEGAVSGGRISERIRLNLSAPPPRVISSR